MYKLMNTYVLMTVLLFLVGLGMLYNVSENFASFTPGESAWQSTYLTWVPLYKQGKTTPIQTAFQNSITSNPIEDKKRKWSSILKPVQVESAFLAEVSTMQTDIQNWTGVGPTKGPVQVDTLSRAIDESVYDCSHNPDYIKKDEIPCWNCTI
jgi:hypothetical protein